VTLNQWERLQNVVDAAFDLPSSERSAYLDRLCAGDSELRQQAQDLIDSHEQAGSFFEEAIGAQAKAALKRPTAARINAAGLPEFIGRYRVIRLMGEGGMGSVYEAEQDNPRRRVALKVIRPGFTTPELLRRFEQEASALGRLQHPGIAQIHEAGTAETGAGPQPYFAMEFIAGRNLLEHAEARHLDIRYRLELMRKVCEAVQHAHERGIIHRDLKPANILVDESGQPKVLDFGIAHVTDSETLATRKTDMGQLIGTLAYMSPEQGAGRSSRH
jgi:serine/threonine protein kinase